MVAAGKAWKELPEEETRAWKVSGFRHMASFHKREKAVAQQQELAPADAKKKCVDFNWQSEQVWTKVRFQAPPNDDAATEPKVQTVLRGLSVARAFFEVRCCKEVTPLIAEGGDGQRL